MLTLLKIILIDIKLCVIQHGVSSEFFKIGPDCRQGDPASPYIFLLYVEIMGLMLRENRDISGIITLFGKEYKVLQYADDTTILLDGSEKITEISFVSCWPIFKMFWTQTKLL